MPFPLILASKSPRRQQLLAQLGYTFTCYSADIDETVIDGEQPTDYVKRLAIAKAKYVAQKFPQSTVLGSDTAVVINGEILGKPNSKEESRAMLSKLSAQVHQVLTSIAVVQQQKVRCEVVTTQVHFKALSADEIERYWHTNEPQDKAGSYGIQGIGGQFVQQIQGCYFAVVGLPLYHTSQLLAEFGLPTPVQSGSKEKKEMI